MLPPSHPYDESQQLSLLEDAIEFAVYRIAVDPGDPHGGRVVMVSPSIKNILGTADPWNFNTWFENIHPADLPRVLEANRRSWQEHVRYDQAVRTYNASKDRWTWVHTISTPSYDIEGNLTHFTGVVIDITEQKEAEIELQRRNALENLILSLSTRFINLPPDEIDPAIDAAFHAICDFTGVDHAFLCLFSEDQTMLSCTHEWCRDGITHQVDSMHNLPTGTMTWSNTILLRGEMLHIPSIEDLPSEAQAEKEQFTALGIRSLLAVPMFYQNKVIGTLRFDAVNDTKSWAVEIQRLLQVVSSIFINALMNKKTHEELKRAHDNLEQRVIERTSELELANETLRKEAAQRKMAEESLQISRGILLEVFDHSPLQLFVQEVLPDGHFRVLRTNPAHQAGSGLPPEKIWGKTVEELVIPEVAESINKHYRDCIAARKPIEYEEQGPSPFWDITRIRTFRTTLAPVFSPQGDIVRIVGASQDITEQKQAEQILMDRAREEAVSAERGRLARELHDAVTQTLFSTTLTAEVLPKIWARNPEDGHKKLEELRELTRGALAEMRTLLMELRPDALADTELTELLKHLSNAFIARARIPVQLHMSGQCELPLDAKVAFYRVAQEGLNNIAKHSEASNVNITLTCQPEETILAIVDDGQGFDTEHHLKAGHYGLSIMHERADQVGAVIQIISQPGHGTAIEMRWQAGPNGTTTKEKAEK